MMTPRTLRPLLRVLAASAILLNPWLAGSPARAQTVSKIEYGAWEDLRPDLEKKFRQHISRNDHRKFSVELSQFHRSRVLMPNGEVIFVLPGVKSFDSQAPSESFVALYSDRRGVLGAPRNLCASDRDPPSDFYEFELLPARPGQLRDLGIVESYKANGGQRARFCALSWDRRQPYPRTNRALTELLDPHGSIEEVIEAGERMERLLAEKKIPAGI